METGVIFFIARRVEKRTVCIAQKEKVEKKSGETSYYSNGYTKRVVNFIGHGKPRGESPRSRRRRYAVHKDTTISEEYDK